MEFVEKKCVTNPWVRSNPISRYLVFWIIPFFLKNQNKSLKLDDLFDPRDSDRSLKLGQELERAWNTEIKRSTSESGRRPSLIRALKSIFGNRYISLFIPYFVTECILRLAPTLLVRKFVKSFENTKENENAWKEQLFFGTALVVSNFVVSFVFHPTFHKAFLLATKIRVAVSVLIFKKILRLSNASMRNTTLGFLTSIISSDVDRFSKNILYIPFVIIGPIQLLMAAYFLWREFGVSSLAGLSIVLIISLLQYENGQLTRKFRITIASYNDQRCRAMDEIVVLIRTIKLYAWEVPLEKVVSAIRKLEVKSISKCWSLKSLIISLVPSTARLVSFLTFLCFCFLGEDLTASKAFFAVALYSIITHSMLYYVPNSVTGMGEISVSLKRIESLLLMEDKAEINLNKEISNVRFSHEEELKGAQKPRIYLKDASASWTGEKNQLENISFDVEGDKLIAVVGAETLCPPCTVGAGKTTLLNLLLGEMPLLHGKCFINGRIGYASQEPWLWGGTARENILLGQPFDEKRYEKVLIAAALLEDFSKLVNGDKTQVGDRGCSLSGGQKSRINLARMLYQKDTDILLMDDPLSSVDAGVRKHLFENCFKRELAGKLRILITHQYEILPFVDHIILMNEGKIIAQGTFKDLIHKNMTFFNILGINHTDPQQIMTMFSTEATQVHHNFNDASLYSTQNDASKLNVSTTNLETKFEGELKWNLYWKYFKAARSPIGICLWIFFCTLAALSATATDFWLSHWINIKSKIKPGETRDDSQYLSVYAGLLLILLSLSVIQVIKWFSLTSRISLNIHDDMLNGILKSPVKFFDENNPARILNRFSKDLSEIDESLPYHLFQLTSTVLSIIGVIGIVVFSNWIVIVPVLFVGILTYLMKNIYSKKATDIKRIEGMARSSVLSCLISTIPGLATVRATKSEAHLICQFNAHLDSHTSAWFMFLTSSCCFSILAEVLSGIVLASVTFGFQFFAQGHTQSGNVGLAVTSAMSLTAWIQRVIRQAAEVENWMVSSERTFEYANLKPEDADFKTSSLANILPKKWPERGAIEFKNVSMAYKNQVVLQKINFCIKPGEKIGIVGRTGAGKSSIIQALFRMVEPCCGEIYIDGINTKNIGLQVLRKNISIIPQDPCLFLGTIRFNLDPFNEYKEDFAIWKALEQVGLKETIPNLSFLVEEHGENLSIGQRQLLCLARALLRNNKIICLDEASSNTDRITDQLISEIVRSQFEHYTVITIAHRLDSVAYCDRILVMADGSIAEFDHPQNLLENQNGVFYALFKNSGVNYEALL